MGNATPKLNGSLHGNRCDREVPSLGYFSQNVLVPALFLRVVDHVVGGQRLGEGHHSVVQKRKAHFPRRIRQNAIVPP